MGIPSIGKGGKGAEQGAKDVCIERGLAAEEVEIAEECCPVGNADGLEKEAKREWQVERRKVGEKLEKRAGGLKRREKAKAAVGGVVVSEENVQGRAVRSAVEKDGEGGDEDTGKAGEGAWGRALINELICIMCEYSLEAERRQAKS
ncbi:MAG: hypothetical protein ACREP8_04525 [Candidatus Binatia bacterium]